MSIRPIIAILRFPKPIEWLLLGVSMALSWHYFWLMDDAFIYFRYVDNLLFLGRGLVFNQGEYVEGFTSPIWTLILIPLRATEIDYWTLIRILSPIFAAVSGVLLIIANRLLSPPAPVINFPLAATAGYYGILCFYSSGMETPLVLIFAGIFGLCAIRQHSKFLQVLVGMSPLIRPELAIALLVYAIWFWVREKRPPWYLMCSAAVFNGAWILFRIYYYADLLPNTFYLKDEANWKQGILYLRNVANAHHWPIIIAILLVSGLWCRRTPTISTNKSFQARILMLVASAVTTIYTVRIGGDMIYHRMVLFPVLLAIIAGSGIPERVLVRISSPSKRKIIATALTMVITGYFFIGYPDQLDSHPITLKSKEKQWNRIEDPMWHRRYWELTPSPEHAEANDLLLFSYRTASPERLRHDRVLVHPFCLTAFYSFNSYVIHFFGLTDAILARVNLASPRPGHKPLGTLALDLMAIHRHPNLKRGRGMMRKAVENGYAAKWISRNLQTIEIIEKKIYNTHDFFENLSLAFTRLGRISPP